MELEYLTRDGKGNDLVKMVAIKEYPVADAEFDCPICNKHFVEGVKLKKIVSSNFTDFAFLGDYICEKCSRLFSLYFYNYIEDDSGIKLLNVRQLKEELCKEQKPPFRFIITTSQKKHLFYRSKVNYRSDYFAVNLETETINTSCERMRLLFDFVENMLVLGAMKSGMKDGVLPFETLNKIGVKAWKFLKNELSRSREIQIPLYCGQKLNIEEEDAICNLNLLLRT